MIKIYNEKLSAKKLLMLLVLFNMSLTNALAVDTDNDDVDDAVDNCTDIPNREQRDTDGDGYGNRCDGDFNNNCLVEYVDLGLLSSVFLTSSQDADLNGDGDVDLLDLKYLRAVFLVPPGPSNAGICTPTP